LIITDTKDVEERDLIVAKRLARQAMAISNNWPGFANTLARAYFVNGEFEKAVAAEADALDRAPDKWKTAFTRTLAKYQAALDSKTALGTTQP
jgi:Tetratricopeptide repeat